MALSNLIPPDGSEFFEPQGHVPACCDLVSGGVEQYLGRSFDYFPVPRMWGICVARLRSRVKS